MSSLYRQAIKSLVPAGTEFQNIVDVDGGKITKWNSPEVSQPTEKEINNKIAELEKQFADNEYQRKRLKEYNAIGLGEQLDMIYHDIDGWKARIKSIKDKYPKP